MPTININQTNASETAKGIAEEATQAEVNAGTDTGGTGAKVFVAPSKLLSLLGSYLTTATASSTYQTISGLFTSVMGLVLTGFSAGANSTVLATDTIAQALAKFQGQINARATLTGTQTITNKRITPRTSTEVSSATPTIATDSVDYHSITALAVAITSFTTNLSGTPTDGQTLWISITDDGTARAIAWGASFESSGNITLPTTTVISTRLDVGFIWNAVTSKWRCVGAA